MGGTDGPADLFMVGNNENFGDGGLNGSANAYLPSSLWILLAICRCRQPVRHTKDLYLSPAFAGFDFGAA